MKRKIILALIIIIVLTTLTLGAIALFKRLEKGGEIVTGEPIQSQPLASDKEAIKERLVAPLGEGGVLTENEDFRVEYYAPDFFQVVIKTTHVAEASGKAINWFKDQGFSEDDICKLPVTFSATPEVEQKLREGGSSYNALPDFCQ